MPGREATGALGRIAQIRLAAPQRPHGLIRLPVNQRFGFHLFPLERAARAVDAEIRAALLARHDLGRRQDAPRAAAQAQQNADVVVDLAAVQAAKVRAQLLDLQSGDGMHHVLRMRSNVGQAARRAGLRRIRAPRSAFVALFLDRLQQPALRVLDHYFDDVAQFAAGDHVARLLHHRVAGVVVGQQEHDAAFLHHAT